MLCLPAFTPVANDAQDVGDSGEWVVPSGYESAASGERRHVRQLPSAIHFSSKCGSMPSNPRMTSFWL